MHRIELKLCAQNNLIKKEKRKKEKQNTKTEFSAFISKWVKNCQENHSMATDSSLKKGYLTIAAVDIKVSCFFCY